MSISGEMQNTINQMIDGHRGILAADESSPTIAKRFAAIGVTSTESNRRDYRAMLLSAQRLGEYICGVILFEETLTQSDNTGTPLPVLARQQNILPGIKVDKGTGPLANATGDKITYGLDGLEDRLRCYKDQGACFAKWREVYPISHHNPTALGLSANAEMLARYAAICQSQGIVPIVEPEVLMDGEHSITRCAQVTEQVLHSVFEALERHHVVLEHILLKPNMVLPGKDCPNQANTEEIACTTLRILNRCVPAAVPSINFLSGGMSPEEATANLNSLNQLATNPPWQLSISYGRALQQPALQAWLGDNNNRAATQAALIKRARLNSLARQGKYTADLENSL